MPDIKQLQELNDVFLAVMGRVFLQPVANEEGPAAELTVQQRKVVFVLEQHGAMKMSELARQIGVTMPAATAVVDRLVKANMVCRELDSSDRRVVLVKITDEGRKVNKYCLDLQQRCFEQILSNLTPDKREALLQAFRQIYTLLHEINLSDVDVRGPVDSNGQE